MSDTLAVTRLKQEFARGYWALTRQSSTGAALCMDTLLSLLRNLDREITHEQRQMVTHPEEAEGSAKAIAVMTYVQDFITRTLVDKSPARPLPSAGQYAQPSAPAQQHYIKVLRSVAETTWLSAPERVEEILDFLRPQSRVKAQKMIEGMDSDQARATLDQAIMDERL